MTQNERPTTQAAINPRVVVFLATHGLPLDTIERDSEGEIKRIALNGSPMPWTAHYSLWIDHMWRDWAEQLGFKSVGGSRAHECAIMAGHTHDEFDAWLQNKVITSPTQGAALDI